MKKLFVSVLSIMMGLSASAQNDKKEYTNFNDTVLSINEVQVMGKDMSRSKALKLDVPKRYLPISTATLPSEVLTNRDITDIQSAVQFIPGVRFQTSYGAFQQVSIRGFDKSIVMIDGVRDERSAIDNSYPFMDLSSIEKIELLKGPSSVLYGSSSVGGVLNIVRKAPIAKNNFNARIAYGSWYNKQATVGFGGKLTGPVNYRANINFQNTEGWRDNKINRLSGYFVLGGKITEKDEFDIRWSGNHDFYSTEIGLPNIMPEDIYNASTGSLYLKKNDELPGLDRKWRYNSESDFMYNRSQNISGQWKHTFSDKVKLMDKLSYSYDDIDYFGTESLDYLTSTDPIYPYYYESGNKRTYISLDSLYYSYPLRFSHIAKTLNNQLELNGKFNTGSIKHNYLAGWSIIYLDRTSYSGYNFGKKGDDVIGPGLTGHGTTHNPHSIGWMETKFSKATPQYTLMNGFYLHDLIEFSKQWKVLLAARYDFYNYKRASGINTINGGRKHEAVNGDEYSKIKNHAFTFRVGGVYLPMEEWSIYASVGSYFKPIRTFYNDNTIYVDRNGHPYTPTKGEEVFKPEKGMQAELGTSYELTNKLKVDFSIFYINKYNMTRTLANKGEVINGETLDKNVIGQVGRMDSKGFDIELTYNPIPGMTFMTGYAYTDAQVREMEDNIWMSSDATKGKQYPRIPKNTFFVLGDYTVQKGFLRGFGVNFDVDFQDKVYRNSANTTYFDSFWLTNLGFSYKFKNGIRAGLNIKNLFNEKYCNQSLGNQFVPSAPRNYMASLSYSF
ncbi:MAG: TonB-dependent receptor [Phocaeicola sp.]|uniref:TonB-dependent receptor n=1 Tax=Phocaeicola sp. TaxID=2773926 RepID=UPI003FA0DDD0